MANSPTTLPMFTDKPKSSSPVECLGLTFENDDARRAYFLDKLRAKLQDPEFRKIEGFPIGADEDILALSDPPYYTACPNPFLQDFIKHYGKPYDPNMPYSKEPFAADVSEGKNDPIYNAHSYHTKVPHKAIMRYILHYTHPGDIVLDGFCGTGMTGVAAQLCGDRTTTESLGYTVQDDGTILDEQGLAFSRLGQRHAVLNDLSPAATFIASVYTSLTQLREFQREANTIIDDTEISLLWLYKHSKGRILSAIWSDVFICPNCGGEFVFWQVVKKRAEAQKSFPCPHCSTIVGKSASKTTGAVKLERAFETDMDPIIGKIIRTPKFILVEQTVRQGKQRSSVPVKPQEAKELIVDLLNRPFPASIPITEFFAGRQTNKLIHGTGISYVSQMYTPRALLAYGHLWSRVLSTKTYTDLLRFCLTSINNYISRKQGYFGGGGGVSGTLFTPSIHLERNVFDVLRRKVKSIATLKVDIKHKERAYVTTQSISDLRTLADNSIDYIFTDPPFGESLQYAELNLFTEAWLKVRTSVGHDCVLNYVHKKDLRFYAQIMSKAFIEYMRILKPGRWITIEFHNSQNAVWAAIQQALEAAGLIVADVRVLDKQQRSFNAVNRAGAVDQDLVISAYKPNRGLEERFKIEAGTEDGAWDFVRTHLRQLPIFVEKDGRTETIAERMSYLLFDRMVAFHVQRGVTVPLSAAEFYSGLNERFSERDNMYFLPEQAAEYDKERLTVKEITQLQLFVTDESSAIQWLKQHLGKKPQTYSELFPQFTKELGGWQKHEKTLELRDLLVQNFLVYDGQGDVPAPIHSYLSSNFKGLRGLPKDDPRLQAKAKDRWYIPDPNKAGDLEKLREKALLREFEEYRASTQRKLKVFRLEAVRAGFKKAWQERDYETIIAVAQKVPEDVLQEDPKLLMWYDQASLRAGHED